MVDAISHAIIMKFSPRIATLAGSGSAEQGEVERNPSAEIEPLTGQGEA
jgi:hypothetical protein